MLSLSISSIFNSVKKICLGLAAQTKYHRLSDFWTTSVCFSRVLKAQNSTWVPVLLNSGEDPLSGCRLLTYLHIIERKWASSLSILVKTLIPFMRNFTLYPDYLLRPLLNTVTLELVFQQINFGDTNISPLQDHSDILLDEIINWHVTRSKCVVFFP